MNLPEDCELTYVVPAEAWYRDVVVRDQRCVPCWNVSARGTPQSV